MELNNKSFSIEPVFSKTEIDLVKEKLSDPLLQHYFQASALSVSQQIAESLPSSNETAEEYLRKVMAAKGQLLQLRQLFELGQEAISLSIKDSNSVSN